VPAETGAAGIAGETAARFGLTPNFFCVAPAALAAPLWAFAQACYLDCPLPSVFKERLFVHLSRFCSVRYCVVRHAGFLIGGDHGHAAGDATAAPETIEQVCDLLRRPVPDRDGLAASLARLRALPESAGVPELRSQAEADLFDALGMMFLDPGSSREVRESVRHVVGAATLEWLVGLLAFARTAHDWTENHPGLALEPDMLALLGQQPELARLLLDRGEAKRARAALRAAVSPLKKAVEKTSHAEAALRENEELRRIALDSGRMGAWWCDTRVRLVWADSALKALYGLPASEGPLPIEAFTAVLAPEVAAAIEAVVADEAVPGAEFDRELEIATGPAAGRWLEWRARVQPDTPWMIVGVSFDVTERRRERDRRREAADRLAFLLGFNDALRPLGGTSDEQGEAMRVLGEYLGVSRAQYFEVDASGQYVDARAGYANGVDPRTGRLRFDDFGPQPRTAYEAGETFVVNDIAELPIGNAGRNMYERAGTRSAVGAPVMRNGRLVAVLGVSHREPRVWTATEIAIIEETAERVQAAAERTSAETSLRASEAKYRALFESIDTGYCVIELIFDGDKAVDYVFRETNPAFTIQARLTDAVGKSIRSIVPDLDAFWFETYGRIARTGKAERFERRIDAQGRWYSVYAFRLGAPEQHHVAVLFQDIEARKRAELALREREERQTFLLELSDALRGLDAPDEIMATVSEMVGRHMQVGRCGYAEVPPSGDVLVVDRDWTDGIMQSLEGAWPLDSFGEKFVSDYRAGKTVIVDDTFEDLRARGVEDALEAAGRVRASIAVPLVKQGRWVGCFYVQQTSPRHWIRSEVELVRDVAERTWAAAERAGAEALLRQGEEKFRSLFETIDEGFCIMRLVRDEHGRIADLTFVETNPAFERHTGLGEVAGRCVSQLLPDFGQHWIETYTRVAETGIAESTEDYLQDVDRWYRVRFLSLGGHDSNLVAVVFEDITDRKRTEASQREREQRQAFLLKLGDALRAEPDPVNVGAVATRMLAGQMGVDRSFICELSRERNLVWIGPEFHGAGTAAAAGKYRLSDFPESMRQLETEPLVIADLRNDDNIPEGAKRSIGSMGMNAMLTGILRKGERDYAWALVVGDTDARAWSAADRMLIEEATDRTWAAVERARVEDALRENQARLQQASHAKDEFIAMLGHELRNPLAPIATTLQLMKLRAPDVFVREREIIDAQVRYLTGLVDDLLDVARIARGKVELEQEPLAVGDIVAAAVETTQPMMEEYRQSLHTQVEDGLMVTGDRRRLVQVLVNLLGNAAKYSPPDRAIELCAVTEDGQVAVRVRDQGRGIAPELLSRIFESFAQDTQAIDRASGGLGLGLAIVRNLVAMHGGSGEALSEGRGKGSEFIVRLPLLERWPAASEVDVESSAGPAASHEAEPAAGRVKVLIVDDFAVAAESLSLLLQEMGYRTHVVHDGAAALQAFDEFEPDIALIDIGLPVMDGYEVARSVRSTPGREHLPLIAITGYGQANDHVRVMEAGFDEHLVKPLRAGKIGPLIEKLVSA
jgi:signal transduction histidine kinase/PAS domain-containing protein